MLRKILTVFLVILLILPFSACANNSNENNKDLSALNNSEKYENCDFIVPDNYTVPIYNGRLIAGQLPDSELMNTAFNNTANNSNNSSSASTQYSLTSTALKNKISEHSGEEVWFRVIIRNHYKNETAVLNYIKEIGGYDIALSNSSESYSMSCDYEASLTSSMIDMIGSLRIAELMLAQYPRNPIYSAVISDSLAIKLDLINNESVEVVVVCSADRLNSYTQELATTPNYSTITVSNNYNKERFMPFLQGLELTCREFNIEINKYIENIMSRNNILEKRVETEVNLGIAWHENGIIDKNFLEEVIAGFNAVLTKAEILKLAEDEEIKVIYLAPQE